MKKTMFILLLLGYAVVHAQVSQDKQFIGVQMSSVNLSSTYYFNVDIAKSQVVVYKENYSLLNTFTLMSPTGYTFNSVSLTDKVFNNSSDLEFLVSFTKTNGDGTDIDMTKLLLFNEKGQIIYDFGAGTMIVSNFLKTVSSSSKMILYRMIYDKSINNYVTNTEIYNVLGNYSGISSIEESDNTKVYVNSLRKTIEFIPLDKTNSYTLKICNVSGKVFLCNFYKNLVDGGIVVSSAGFPSGIYIYNVNGESGKLLIK